jgi:NADH-quinone oxidoreductase subunit N
VDAGAPSTLVDVFRLIVPEIILFAGACVLFMGATFRGGRDRWASVAVVTVILAGLALWYSGAWDVPISSKAASVVLDPFAVFVKVFALAGGLVLVLVSWNEIPDRHAAEYHACLLLIIAGACLTGGANELVTLFLALELISIPTYVLLYLPRYDNAAQEAAVKYFLLSVFSSALLLFGFSYLYGLAGTTNLPALQEALQSSGRESMAELFDPERRDALPIIALVALAMVVGGLGFRITAVPFHFYAPDVYQGTPAIVAALLAFIPKAAGFFAFCRLLGFVGDFHGTSAWILDGRVSMIFYSLAAVSMTLGNMLALLQDNIKRLLAYSSVAHAGYMLIGLTVAQSLQEGDTGGVDAVLFYLVAYGAMTVGAFAVVAYLSTRERPVETVDDLAGLGVSRPVVALLMSVFLLSLIGIPLTAGFAGKLLLFWGALTVPAGNHPWLFTGLAFLGAINAGIASWYYLRILAVMYFRTALRPLEKRQSLAGLATLWICALLTIAFGVYPDPLSRAARLAATHTATASVEPTNTGR